MKSPLGCPVAGNRRRAAFTLIELLAVMAIILVLAGLILNIAGSANYNSAKGRATAEIQAISTALESYKSDNGVYPQDPYVPATGYPTGLLDPQAHFDPTNAKYLNNSEFLYQVLSGFTVTIGATSATPTPTPSSTQALSKAYMTFRPDQLHMSADTTAAAGTAVSTRSPYNYLIDPFGFSYGYSTINSVATAYNTANPTSPISPLPGYNPTFDLWSTAGYAPGGKATPTYSPAPSSSPAAYSAIWIKNW